MYVLKKITTNAQGNKIEIVQVLGNCYHLYFLSPEDRASHHDVVARVTYFESDCSPAIDISLSDEAYITTLTGDTVRAICRGKPSEVLGVVVTGLDIQKDRTLTSTLVVDGPSLQLQGSGWQENTHNHRAENAYNPAKM